MADTYGFLRFQIPGAFFILYLVGFVSPFVTPAKAAGLLSNMPGFLSLLGSLVVVGLSIGYLIHQFSVNRFRRSQWRRPGHDLLETFLEATSPGLLSSFPPEEKLIILDSLMTSLPFTTGISNEHDLEAIAKKLDGRWSHLYARAALGKYSPACALAVTLALVVVGMIPESANIPVFHAALHGAFSVSLLSLFQLALILMVVFATTSRVNSYARKLWGEICDVELLYVKAIIYNWDVAAKIVGDLPTLVSQLRAHEAIWNRNAHIGKWKGLR